MINNPNNMFKSEANDEVDFPKIINLLIRNKILISTFTVSLFILSCIFALTKKRVWEGQFEIVVRQGKDVNPAELFLSGSPKLLDALGDDLAKSSKKGLKTEIGILESSSVLMPVFETFKKEKLNLNNSERITFNSWKKNLDVDLKKNTSILEISFRDTDKKLINMVLEKIIGIYQEYSGKARKRNLELTNIYLTEQIDIYKTQVLISMREMQEYALDQDLSALDYEFNVPGRKRNDINANTPKALNIEQARVIAANTIRNIDAKIKKIESLETDFDAITYINLTIPDLGKDSSINDLSVIDIQLLELQSKYTDKFPAIIRLKEKRKALIKLLKEKSIGFLKAKKVSAQAVVEAATRPKGVLLKYKELARKAQRDDLTLVQLENQKRLTNLQQAKLEDPWELITKPTINNSPIAPRRSLIAIFGTFFGFIGGISIAIFKERKSGLIYEADDLESILGVKIIERIDLNNQNSNLLIKEIFKQSKDKIFKFIYSKYLAKMNPESLRNIFENKKYNSSIVNQLFDLKDNEILILVVSIPQITFDELLKIKNQTKFLEKELFGIVLIEE